jgi:excisionase family DNA binding protein
MGDLKIYTATETCELLKISQRTLYRYINDGSIKGFRAGRQYRFTEEDIKDFIEARRGARPRKRKTTEGA